VVNVPLGEYEGEGGEKKKTMVGRTSGGLGNDIYTPLAVFVAVEGEYCEAYQTIHISCDSGADHERYCEDWVCRYSPGRCGWGEDEQPVFAGSWVRAWERTFKFGREESAKCCWGP
jgi:hypothetical protein